MPWASIPPKRPQHIPFFGYTVVAITDDRLWVQHQKKGRFVVKANAPFCGSKTQEKSYRLAVGLSRGRSARPMMAAILKTN